MTWLYPPRHQLLLAENDSVESLEGLIDDCLFPHLYWATLTFRAGYPTNPMGKLAKALLRLSGRSKAHVLPLVVATALPDQRDHIHTIFACDKPITPARFRKSWRWGNVKIDPYDRSLAGVEYIVSGHVQQPPYQRCFCPSEKRCGVLKSSACVYRSNLPFERSNRALYEDTQVFRAFVNGRSLSAA